MSKHHPANSGTPEHRTAAFVRRAVEVHGTKYSYEKTVLASSRMKVTITCPLHGDFEQNPYNHLYGRGCAICARNVRRTAAQFIVEAKAKHGTKYRYTSCKYKNTSTPVAIECPVHGMFFQQPISHLRGHGCSKCRWKGPYTPERLAANPDLASKPAILYVLEMRSCEGAYIKIGVTTKKVEQRIRKFREYDPTLEITVAFTVPGSLADVFRFEQDMKTTFVQLQYIPSLLAIGSSECFTLDALPTLRQYADELKSRREV